MVSWECTDGSCVRQIHRRPRPLFRRPTICGAAHVPFCKQAAIHVSGSALGVGQWPVCYASMRKYGPVAQRLEQGTHNPLVPGSNPGGPILEVGVQNQIENFFSGAQPIKPHVMVWVAFMSSIFPVLRDWDERLSAKRNGIPTPSGAAQRIGAIARSGDQFGIVRGASVSRTVVVLTCDCVLVWATRCRWQFSGEPEGNCRARDFLGQKIAEKRV
jgi:hypothetical protein